MSNLILPSSNINNIKMVIFDKDGTLIDVHHYWCSMIELRAKFFIESLKESSIDKGKLYNNLVDSMGIDLKTKKMKREGPVGIKPRSFIIDVALATLNKYIDSYTKEMVADIFNQVDEHSKAQLSIMVKILPGVKKVLNDLTSAGIQVSIATTDLGSRGLLAMKELELDMHFTDIVGAESVEHAKPSADLVNYILNKHNVSKEDVVVVGDSMADLGMAKNAQCKFIGVKTGLYNEEFIRNSEYLIETLDEVKVNNTPL